MRRGLGKGLGMGYKNLTPMDSHIHSLSAKGMSIMVGDVVKINNRKGTESSNLGIVIGREYTAELPEWQRKDTVAEDTTEIFELLDLTGGASWVDKNKVNKIRKATKKDIETTWENANKSAKEELKLHKLMR